VKDYHLLWKDAIDPTVFEIPSEAIVVKGRVCTGNEMLGEIADVF